MRSAVSSRPSRGAVVAAALLVLPVVVLVTAPPASAHAFYLYAPWDAGVTMDVGGCGNFYHEGKHDSWQDKYSIDINHKSCGDDCGFNVRAAAAGTIAIVGSSSAYGRYVVIDHGKDANGDRYWSLYAHMPWNSVPVQVGDSVTNGAKIGKIGTTGNSSGCHLHFEFRKGGSSIWSAAAHKPSPLSGVVLTAGVNVKSDNVPPPTCTAKNWDSEYKSKSHPGALEAGASSAVTLKFKNVGCKAWTKSSSSSWNTLVCTSPRVKWALRDGWDHSQCPTTVKEKISWKEWATLTFDIKGPKVCDATYTSKFRMWDDGPKHFGDPSPAVTVRVRDTTDPTGAWVTPRPGATYVDGADQGLDLETDATVIAGAAPFVVRVSAADAGAGVARVDFLVDGVVAHADAQAPFTWSWPLFPGPVELAARVVDACGHSVTLHQNVFVVGATPP